MMRLGLLPLARPTFDVPFAEDVLRRAFQTLDGMGHEFVGERRLLFSNDEAAPAIEQLGREKLDAVIVLQVTFADAGMILKLADAVDCPLVVWGFPEPRWGGRPRLNALCGINLATHALRRANKNYRFVYAAPEDHRAVGEAVNRTDASEAPAWRDVARSERDPVAADIALKALQKTRIGLVGEHPDGFETCRYDDRALAERLGVAVHPIALNQLFDAARSVPQADVTPVLARVQRELAGLDQVDAEATEKSCRLYAALRSMGAEQKLAGFAVRCWPEMFTDYGCAVCGALGMLNEDALPCACEADVVGNVTNLILQALSGTPPWVVDLVHADPDDDTAVIWHCGLAPRSMASSQSEIRADIHANRMLPLLQSFTLKPGRVTIARLSQATNDLSMVVAGAEMIEAPMSFGGTSGVLKFDRPVGEVVDDLLSFGLEHHVSIAYGDHRPALRAVAEQLSMPLLELT